MPHDDLGHRVVIAPQQLAQMFGIVPARQLGRADEIAKQYGELTPLRRGGRGRNLGMRRLGRGGWQRL